MSLDGRGVGGCGPGGGVVSADDSPAARGYGPAVPNPYFLAGWRAAGPVPSPGGGGTRSGVGLACARTAPAEVTATLHLPTGFLLARVETFAGRPASRCEVRAVTFSAPRPRGAR